MQAYLSGEATPSEKGEIEAHLRACASCRDVVAALDETRGGGAAAGAPALAPGTTVGRFVVEDVLGAGGMGVVYAAHDPELDRRVALKLLRVESSERRERLAREAQALARVSHPNVCAVYDIGAHDGRVFVAMELVDGQSLGEWLREAPRTVADIVPIFVAAARGLAAAHRAGVVHRDFKPDNVLLGHDGRVRVTDFGLAARLPSPRGPAEAGPGLTGTGVVLGTPLYMPPEQHAGGRADERSDQFSFAVALYEALYRQLPFSGRSVDEIVKEIRAGHVRPPPRGVRVPARLEAIVRRGLATRPEDRFASMTAVADALEPRRSRSRLWLAGGSALVAAIVVPFLWAERGARRQPSGDPPASIAVLPFQAVGGESGGPYLAEGMAESVTADLARTKGLAVVARSSAFHYRGAALDPGKVGRELGARYLLQGSVLRSGERLRVNVQLIEAETGRQVWTERFDRPRADVLAVEDEIARGAAGAMEAAPDGPRPTGRSPASFEAYDHYLKGTYDFQKEDRDMDKAIAHLERAVAIDPGYALAHAFLGKLYARMYFGVDSWEEPSKEWEQKATVEIMKALDLDPGLAEAFEARANLIWTAAGGFPHDRAIEDLRHAIQLNPNLAAAHNWLAVVYRHVGLVDRAMEEAQISARLDPLGRGPPVNIALGHLSRLDAQAALDACNARPSAELRATVAPLALLYLGRVAEARALIDELARTSAAAPATGTAATPAARRTRELATSPIRALVLARAGDRAGALAELARAQDYVPMIQGRGHVHHDEYLIASTYAVLGERARAIDWLERTANEGMPCHPCFARDPHLDSLRGDPRFEALMARLKADLDRRRAAYSD